MATTSLSLGTYWDDFIRDKLESGHYASATEVVRAALRALEEQEKRLAVLRAHLAEGSAQAERGEFVENFSVARVIEQS